MPTRLVLIRHAATNVEYRLCGSFDVRLSVEGRAELHACVRRPARAPVPDALFTSTLIRAAHVAGELSRAWGLEPQPAAWAREIDCGDLEGVPIDRLRSEFPDLWSRNEAENDDAFAWPGGETYAHFRARVLDGLTQAAATHRDGRVVVVTHAGVISQVLGVIKGRPASVWKPDRPGPLTATEVLWDQDAPRAVISFNDPDWY